MSLQAAFRRQEQAKKREYGERVREVEHGVFTPLVRVVNMKNELHK